MASSNTRTVLAVYEVGVTALVIVAIILVNVLVLMVPWQYDGTISHQYTLTAVTRDVLKELQPNTVIRALYRDKAQIKELDNLLQVYERTEPKLTVQFIDPDMNPVLISSFDPNNQGIPYGSLIIANDTNFDIILPNDLFVITYDFDGFPAIIGNQMEQRITSSLYKIGQAENPVIYQVLEHRERDVRTLPVYQNLMAQGYDIKNYSIFEQTIPVENSLLLLLSPKTDLTALECEILEAYLNTGGRLFLSLDYVGNEYPNIGQLLEKFSLRLDYGIVIEADLRRNAGSYVLVIPAILDHRSTASLQQQGMNLVVPLAMGISEIEGVDDVIASPLLESSRDSWLRFDLSEQKIEYTEATDYKGPIHLAWAVQGREETNTSPRLIVTSSGAMFDAIQDIGAVKANIDFFLDGIHWVQSNDDTVSVPPRITADQGLSMHGLQVVFIAVLFIGVLPLLLSGVGVAIWMKRRHL